MSIPLNDNRAYKLVIMPDTTEPLTATMGYTYDLYGRPPLPPPPPPSTPLVRATASPPVAHDRPVVMTASPPSIDNRFCLPPFDDHLFVMTNLELQRLYYEVLRQITTFQNSDFIHAPPTKNEIARHIFNRNRLEEINQAIIALQKTMQYK